MKVFKLKIYSYNKTVIENCSEMPDTIVVLKSSNTEEPINELKTKTATEYVRIARDYFNTGRTKDLNYREQQLKRFLQCVQENIDEFSMALHKDMRRHPFETRIIEIEPIINDLKHTIYEFRKWAKPDEPEKGLPNILDGVYRYKDPYGVVLIIGSWNFPISLNLGPMIGALAAGNAIILKPSDVSVHVSQLLANILPKYIDEQLVQVYLGGVDETTQLLQQHFDYIFFTGSTHVGRIVYQLAAKNLTPVTLELGGKTPVYIDDNVDIKLTTKRILWGKLFNIGQTCIAPDYILCSKLMQDEFIKNAKLILYEFYGVDPVYSTNLCRIINERHFNRLIELIQTENIAYGGKYDANELFIEPTILINVKSCDKIMQEEIFGPLLPILLVNDANEAVDFVNSKEKPLALYVFSQNRNTIKLFLQCTSSGGVCVNDTVTHVGVENLPFGGVGASGIGRGYHGRQGFDTFTHKKSVLMKNFNFLTEKLIDARYPPYTEWKLKYLVLALRKRKPIMDLKWWKYIFVFVLGFIVAFLGNKWL